MEEHNSTLIPMVVEQTARGERAFDIYIKSAFASGSLLNYHRY